MDIVHLGEAKFPSPALHVIDDRARVSAHIVRLAGEPARDALEFEIAGPRTKLFFNPPNTRAGVVTCGGLCPGAAEVPRRGGQVGMQVAAQGLIGQG